MLVERLGDEARRRRERSCALSSATRLVDRLTERSPDARSVTSTPPAASDRGLTRDDGRHAEQLGIGELHARRLVAVVVQDRYAGIGQAPVERLPPPRATAASRLAPIATRCARYGATSTGQAMPFSSWCASTMQASARPSPMPYEPITGWRRLPSSARNVAPSASVKSVPSLKMLPTSMPVRQAHRRAAVRAGIPLARVRDVGHHVRREVAPDVDVAQVAARAGSRPPPGSATRAASSSTTTTVSCAPIGEP